MNTINPEERNCRRHKKIEINLPCLWISRIHIVKVFTLPKDIYRINALLIKISMAFSQQWKKNPKVLVRE
jgi:hypothetical protein